MQVFGRLRIGTYLTSGTSYSPPSLPQVAVKFNLLHNEDQDPGMKISDVTDLHAINTPFTCKSRLSLMQISSEK
jgi:hypothetical protein